MRKNKTSPIRRSHHFIGFTVNNKQHPIRVSMFMTFLEKYGQPRIRVSISFASQNIAACCPQTWAEPAFIGAAVNVVILCPLFVFVCFVLSPHCISLSRLVSSRARLVPAWPPGSHFCLRPCLSTCRRVRLANHRRRGLLGRSGSMSTRPRNPPTDPTRNPRTRNAEQPSSAFRR